MAPRRFALGCAVVLVAMHSALGELCTEAADRGLGPCNLNGIGAAQSIAADFSTFMNTTAECTDYLGVPTTCYGTAFTFTDTSIPVVKTPRCCGICELPEVVNVNASGCALPTSVAPTPAPTIFV